MKHFYLTLFILAGFAMATSSQNYTTIKPNSINHFAFDSTSVILTIKLDTVIYKTDTTEYYNFPMIRRIGPNSNNGYCTTKGTSWLGKKVSVFSNGWNYFYNYLNDTLKINTLATLNTPWIAHKYSSDSILKATIISIAPEIFLGITDSVKTINFQLYDSAGIAISTPLNNYQIKLSKNYGIIKLFSFYNFPFNQSNYDDIYYFPQDQQMSIIGMSSPMVGWQNTINYDYFDFEIGQEMHTREYSQPYLDLYTPNVTNYTINKILQKSFSPDSVFYDISRCYNRYSCLYNQDPVISEGQDTIKTGYPIHSKLDNYSLEFDGVDNFISKTMREARPSGYLFLPSGQDSLLEPISEGSCIFDYFINAGLYYSCTNFYGSPSGLDLLYFKDSTLTYGTPLVCSILLNVPQINKSKNITINCSPYEHKVQITSAYKTTVTIYNTIGALIQKCEIVQQGNFYLPSSGIYIISCDLGDEYFTQKIICF